MRPWTVVNFKQLPKERSEFCLLKHLFCLSNTWIFCLQMTLGLTTCKQKKLSLSLSRLLTPCCLVFWDMSDSIPQAFVSHTEATNNNLISLARMFTALHSCALASVLFLLLPVCQGGGNNSDPDYNAWGHTVHGMDMSGSLMERLRVKSKWALNPGRGEEESLLSAPTQLSDTCSLMQKTHDSESEAV